MLEGLKGRTKRKKRLRRDIPGWSVSEQWLYWKAHKRGLDKPGEDDKELIRGGLRGVHLSYKAKQEEGKVKCVEEL